MSLSRSAGAGFLAAALLAQPAPAQSDAHDMGEALGAIRAVFYHELGHGLIDVLDLDTVGAEENVVDEFSTMLLILQGRRDNRQIEALLSTARFWSLASQPDQEARHYYSEHDFNAKRFFAIICLLHGSDPGRFYPIMAELGIPSERARKCEFEFREKAENWINILAPHVHGIAPADRTGGFAVSYVPASADGAHAVARVWQQARFVESLAQEAGAIFALPVDIPVVARECGQANAFWDGQAITLCYELHQAMMQSFASARGEQPQAGARTTPAAAQADALGSRLGDAPTGTVNVGDLLGSGSN